MSMEHRSDTKCVLGMGIKSNLPVQEVTHSQGGMPETHLDPPVQKL